ncbi:MAG: class II aldolase/adducin family protein [Desulfovibrio sp.]|jgi:rhamnose utilization protein RhaD (predicted bifunctional aldolase and dehydrogenase)|nr:class II aldolase/adducin family protein [Desulfovibrio sp.]
MGTAADELAGLCATLGSNPLFTQGPGGNVSVKDGDRLWIKASGSWLADAANRDIFLPVSRSAVLEIADRGLKSFPARGGRSPSVEVVLHALLPQRLVLHLHMLDAIIQASLPDARQRLDSLLSGLAWRFLPYARPGLPLSRLAQDELRNDDTSPSVFILKNHGVVIAARDQAEAISLTNTLARRLWLAPRPLLVPDIPALLRNNDLQWRIPTSPWPHALAFGKAAAALRRNWPLCPEQVFCLGAKICVIAPETRLGAAVRAFSDANGYKPPLAVIPECGVLFAPDIDACAEALVEGMAHVALRTPENVPLETLGEADLAQLAPRTI